MIALKTNEGWQNLLHGQLQQDFQIANLEERVLMVPPISRKQAFQGGFNSEAQEIGHLIRLTRRKKLWIRQVWILVNLS